MTLTRTELKEMLSRARRMETGALAQIHDRFYPEVYRYVRFRLPAEENATAIASQVFLRLPDALSRGRGPLDLRRWLLDTAARLVDDDLHGNSPHPPNPLDDLAGGLAVGRSPQVSTEVDWAQRRVRQALQRLSPEEQHILALRFAIDLSLEEAAQVVGRKANTVKEVQFHALVSLRRILSDENEH